MQLHVRAFYTNKKIRFRAETEPSRFVWEHFDKRFRSYKEGIRAFMQIMERYEIYLEYEGSILDLYVAPKRRITSTPWIPLIIAGIIVFVPLIASLAKPKEE